MNFKKLKSGCRIIVLQVKMVVTLEDEFYQLTIKFIRKTTHVEI